MNKKITIIILAFFSSLAIAAGTIHWGDLVIKGDLSLQGNTASTVPYIDSNNVVQSSSVTPTELGYVHGVTSAIQTQLNAALVNPMTTLGDLVYEDASPVPARLSGNTTSTKMFLSQTGTGIISAAPSWVQPECGDLSNAVASCSTDTTNATNISSGTLNSARLPNPAATTLGGVKSKANVSHQWINSISTAGAPTSTQPAFTDISGTAAVNQGGTGQTAYTDGQLLIGNTATGGLSKATLTAGSNITITNGNGTISIASSGGGSSAYNYTAQTTTYSASINDWVVASGASFTITLPTAVGVSGQAIIIQHNGTSLSQVYTLNTTSSQTINGPGGAVSSGNYALYTNGEKVHLVSDGSNWQVLAHSTNTGWVSGGANVITATSAYVFTVTSANATAGATYTNNGQTFTVSTTISAGTTLTCSGTGTPAASGTLTKASGTGDATITFSSKTVTGVPAKGVTAVDVIQWKRAGSSAIVNIVYKQTASTGSAAGSGVYLFTLPVTVDTNVIPVNTSTSSSIFDTSSAFDSFVPTQGWVTDSVPNYMLSLVGVLYSPTQIRFGGDYTQAAIAVVDSSHMQLSNAGTAYNITITVPVLGWQP